MHAHYTHIHTHSRTYTHTHSLTHYHTNRLEPIMLPIMLLSSAQNFGLLSSKLCFLNQHYAQELTVFKVYQNFLDCCIRISDCSIRVSQSYFCEVLIISQERVQKTAFQGFLVKKAVKICTVFRIFGVCIVHLIKIHKNRPIMLA